MLGQQQGTLLSLSVHQIFVNVIVSMTSGKKGHIDGLVRRSAISNKYYCNIFYLLSSGQIIFTALLQSCFT